MMVSLISALCQLLFSIKVHSDHLHTVEDDKKIDKEIEELERKIKAVSNCHHCAKLFSPLVPSSTCVC